MNNNSRIPSYITHITCISILFLITLVAWNVNFVEISGENSGTIAYFPCSNRYAMMTRYIHSVELTPVEDYYIVTGGKIWSWEERVRSSKAGMPSTKPPFGRYIETDKWMIYQGGHICWDRYYYRIGNEHLGLNQAKIYPYKLKNMYNLFTGERLLVRIHNRGYKFTTPYFCREFLNAPSGVDKINKPLHPTQ